jgi:hypothetical protein
MDAPSSSSLNKQGVNSIKENVAKSEIELGLPFTVPGHVSNDLPKGNFSEQKPNSGHTCCTYG